MASDTNVKLILKKICTGQNGFLDLNWRGLLGTLSILTVLKGEGK